MLDRGLVAEVRGLLDRGYRDTNALKSVGYEEIIAFLEGALPNLEAAINLVKRNTRRYAKRQLTWFRRDHRIHWINPRGKTLSDLSTEITLRM